MANLKDIGATLQNFLKAGENAVGNEVSQAPKQIESLSSYLSKQPLFNNPTPFHIPSPTVGQTVKNVVVPVAQQTMRTAFNVKQTPLLQNLVPGPNYPQTAQPTKFGKALMGPGELDSLPQQVKKGVDVPLVGKVKGAGAVPLVIAGAAINLAPFVGGTEKLGIEGVTKLASKLRDTGLLQPNEVKALLTNPDIQQAITKSGIPQKFVQQAVATGDARGLLTTIRSKLPQAVSDVLGDLNKADAKAAGQDLNRITGQGGTVAGKDLIAHAQANPSFLQQLQSGKINLDANIENPLKEVGQNVSDIVHGAAEKERQFITSIKEGENTPDALKQIIAGTYIPKSGKQLTADARALIRTDPAAAEKLALNPQNDTHIQIGNELLNHYASTGETAKAKQLGEQMAQSGTEFGRSVQAFANYDKTTPAGAIKFAQSKVNEFNKANPGNKLKLTDDQVQNLFTQARKIQNMAEGRDRNIAANDLIEKVNELIPSSIADKAVTVWKAGLLTSLRTHERNLIGNSLHAVAETAKDIPATLADKAMAMATGTRTLTPTLRGTVSGGEKGLQSAKDIVTKGYDPEQTIAKFDVNHITWGKNPIEQGLKKYTDTVFRTLGAADKPFYSAALARSLYDQAGAEAINAGKQGEKAFIENLVKNPNPAMIETAVKDANIATFHNSTKLSQVAAELQKFKFEGVPIGQIVAPFTGVPSSVAGQMMAYSPAGLIKGIYNASKVVSGKIPELQRQAAQEIGRGVIGSGLLGVGAYLAQQGLITGQPKNPQEAAQWQLEGKQANSVLIGGKWRAIGSIGPENLVILAGAKAAQELKDPSGSIPEYLSNIGKDFLGQTFLQGVQGPLNAVNDPTRYGKSYVGNTLASIVPNIVKDTSKAFDPIQRQTNTVSDYVKNSIPGLRNQGLPNRDNLGNPVKQEPTGIGAYVDLLNSKTPISNAVVNELDRLDQSGNNATPGQLTKNQTIQGVKMQLNPQQLDTLNAQSGGLVSQALGSLFQNPDYEALDDQDKANAISSVVASVRKQVRGTIDINNPSTAVPSVTLPTVSQATTATPKGPTISSGTRQFTVIDPTTGSVKSIDLSKVITPPTLTGNAALDKKLTSSYNSALTTRANDIVTLYKAGKIDASTAEKELEKLTNQKTTGAKKPKKISIKASPAAKITALKTSVIKMATTKKMPTTKTSAGVIKMAKAPKAKLTAFKIVKPKVTLARSTSTQSGIRKIAGISIPSSTRKNPVLTA